MCVYDEHPLASQDTIPSNQELVGIQNDSASKSWSKYTIISQSAYSLKKRGSIMGPPMTLINKNHMGNWQPCLKVPVASFSK